MKRVWNRGLMRMEASAYIAALTVRGWVKPCAYRQTESLQSWAAVGTRMTGLHLSLVEGGNVEHLKQQEPPDRGTLPQKEDLKQRPVCFDRKTLSVDYGRKKTICFLRPNLCVQSSVSNRPISIQPSVHRS